MNNIEFIIYANKQIGKPYIFGTYGQKLTEKVLMESHKLYPNYTTVERLNYALNNNFLGQKVHDCSGLFKGFLMQDGENSKYNPEYDKNVKMLFDLSPKKYCLKDYSNTAALKRFNTTVGVALCNKSFTHIIYIVDEYKNSINNMTTVEAKGFDYGVVSDRLINILDRWEDGYIFELPFIEYVNTGLVEKKTYEPTGIGFTDLDIAHKDYYTNKDIQDIAQRTIKGEFANGQIRRDIFKLMGISYDMIQARVNKIIKHESIKSDLEIAKEAYRGSFGNGYTRQQNITREGYDYRYIQKLVNDYIVNDKWG